MNDPIISTYVLLLELGNLAAINCGRNNWWGGFNFKCFASIWQEWMCGQSFA